jgi:Ca-activated chloride channel homolog
MRPELRRPFWAVLLAVAFQGYPQATNAYEPPPKLAVFGSSAERVRLEVLVTRGGRPVSGLSGADFELRDDGKPVEVRSLPGELPIHALLLLDASGSVEGSKLEYLRTAAQALLENLAPDDKATLLSFSYGFGAHGGIGVEPARAAEQLPQIRAGGTTALFDALYGALLLPQAGAARNLLLVFTDGVNQMSWLSADRVLGVAREADVVVEVVSAGEDAAPQSEAGVFLRSLAVATGGTVWHSEEGVKLREAFLEVLAEFRSRYILEFEPRSERPGFHRLELRVRHRAVSVKARPGYLYDPSPAP